MSYARTASVFLVFPALFAAAAWSQDQAGPGNAAFEQGDFLKAADHYTQALRSKPSFALYVNLAHCYTRLERWNDAAQAYRAAIDLDSESVTAPIWRFLAQALYNDNRFQQAMKAFSQAESLEPNDQDDIWIARCMIELEQWVQAKSVLLGRLKRDPSDIGTLELLAYVLGQVEDWPGVMDVYRQLLIASPDHTDYRIALANALAGSGRNMQAIDALEFAWRLDRSLSGRINRLLADLYLAEKMPREAAACYARVIVTSENPSADDYYRLGVTYFQTGELTSAWNAFAGMLKADPSDSKPDLYLGHVAAQRGDANEALLHYGAAIEKDPTAVEAFVALVDLQMKNRRYKDAAAHLAKAIELGDNRPLVHHNLILAFMRQTDMERAVAALKDALAEHPSDAGLLSLLDRCVEKMALQDNNP